MKKLLSTFLALIMIFGCFSGLSFNASAQSCAWTLYVNGKAYSSTASYATSGKLTWLGSGGTVYLNNFKGQTIEAIPGGFYDDDDAPCLNIVATGTNKLTGDKLDDGSYGCIYSEPRQGGSGEDSQINISGTGKLILSSITNPYAKAEDLCYNAMVAGSVTVKGSVNLEISQSIYGLQSEKGVYGINAVDDVDILTSGNVIIKTSVLTAKTSSGFVYKPNVFIDNIGTWTGKGNVNIANTAGYTSLIIDSPENSVTSSENINGKVSITTDTAALYLKCDNAYGFVSNKEGTDGAVLDIVNSKSAALFEGTTDSVKCRAYIPTGTNSKLTELNPTEFVKDTDILALGENASDFTTAKYKEFANCYIKKTALKSALTPKARVLTSFTVTNNARYTYRYYVVPKPGYYLKYGSGKFTSDNIKNIFTYEPSNVGVTALVSFSYVYRTPVIKTDNTVDKIYSCSCDFLSVVINDITDCDVKYQWYLKATYGETVKKEIKIPFDNMNGFDGMDTATLSYDGSVMENDTVVFSDGGKDYKYSDLDKLELYCKISTVSGSVESAGTQWIVGHNFSTTAVKNGQNHYFACQTAGCDVKKYNEHEDDDKNNICDVCGAKDTVITKNCSDVITDGITSAKFSVEADGEGTLTYQWFVRVGNNPAKALADNSAYSGTKTKELTITATTEYPICELNGNKYYCVVGGDGGTADSKVVTLTVNHKGKGTPVDNGDGTHTAICYCNASLSNTAHEYLPGDIVTNATCTTAGTRKYKCSVCGNEKTDSYTDKNAHSLTKVAAKAATCKATGNIEYYKCSVCQKLFTDKSGTNETTASAVVTPVAKHTLSKVSAKTSTCKVAGNKEYYKCSVCNKLFTDSTGKTETTLAKVSLELAEHTFDLSKGTIITEATCACSGIKKCKCTVCGQEEILDYSGDFHKIVKVAGKAPTCKETGIPDHYECTVCKVWFTDSEGLSPMYDEEKVLDKTENHIWDSGKVTTAATKEKEGVKTYTCTVCGKTKTESISKLTEDKKTVLGDVNLDTKVNTKDARKILRFVAKLETFTDEQKANADVNNDGKLNTKDARKILRVVAKLEIM